MTTYTYSPEDVTVHWVTPSGLTLDISDGFGEGTFITVSRDEDSFSKQVGANGKVVRTRNANRSGTVELTLMQQSVANGQLMLQAYADDTGTSQIGDILIKSANLEVPVVIMTIRNAWIRKLPDETASKENGERVWTLDAEEVKPDVASAQTVVNLGGAVPVF